LQHGSRHGSKKKRRAAQSGRASSRRRSRPSERRQNSTGTYLIRLSWQPKIKAGSMPTMVVIVMWTHAWRAKLLKPIDEVVVPISQLAHPRQLPNAVQVLPSSSARSSACRWPLRCLCSSSARCCRQMFPQPRLSDALDLNCHQRCHRGRLRGPNPSFRRTCRRHSAHQCLHLSLITTGCMRMVRRPHTRHCLQVRPIHHPRPPLLRHRLLHSRQRLFATPRPTVTVAAFAPRTGGPAAPSARS
jgi:hypothetical protein